MGVNTGDVVVGRAREGSSFVTGDAVNVAARLEQAAAPGEVLAGERTVTAAGGAFDFGDARVVDAKGKPGGVACRPVLRALTLMRPRGVGGLQRVFVGRESELELLRATYRRAVAQREPHLVTIVGEPGIGKTRLVRELWEALADEDPPPLRRTGRCLAYGDGITYWPLGEILREHFGIHEGDAQEQIRERLAEREILGLALGLDVAGGLHPAEARERLHEAVVRLVEELAVERPLVLLVEDVHWAEDDLLDLLERVVRDVRGAVLLLATARPELFGARSSWSAGRRNATTLWLEPLAPDATAQMLDGLLSLELPPAIEELVVAKTEGNPFFVEELVGELVDAGVLERHDDAWRTSELPEGFSVPDSVHAVLAARIDRLPSTEKAALQAASVVGRLFWAGPIVHLLDGAEPSFDLLEERDFVRSRAGSSLAGEREYAIKHALTREVAYSSIPKARRARLHAALAQWLERRVPTTDEYAPLLAYHYSQAVDPQDADLAWGDEPEELGRLRAQCGPVARARRRPCDRAVRDARRRLAPPAGDCARPEPRGQDPALAPHRARGRPSVRRGDPRRGARACDRAHRGPRGACRPVQPARLPHRRQLRHVQAAARPGPHRRLDRPRARARCAAERPAGAGARLARVARRRGERGCRPRGDRLRRRARRRPAQILGVGGPGGGGVPGAEIRRGAHLGQPPPRGDRPARRSRTTQPRSTRRSCRLWSRSGDFRKHAGWPTGTSRTRAPCPRTTGCTARRSWSRWRSCPRTGRSSSG